MTNAVPIGNESDIAAKFVDIYLDQGRRAAGEWLYSLGYNKDTATSLKEPIKQAFKEAGYDFA